MAVAVVPPPQADVADVAAAPPPAPARRRGWLLTLPAVVVLGFLLVAPFLVFTVYAFLQGGFYEVTGTFTLSNFTSAVGSDLTRRLTLNALGIGFVTAVLSLALGVPLAYAMRYRAGRLEYPLLALVVFSMFTSYLVRIYAWRVILGNDGLLTQLLGPVGLAPRDGSLLFSKPAVVAALVHIFVPYVALVAYAAFRNIPGDFLDLAADLGAGRVQRWRRVVLPLVAPAAASGFLYTFVLAASDYVTPQFLGGTDGNMVGLQISQQFTQFGNYPLGAATSIIVLLLFMLAYAVVTGFLRVLGLNSVVIKG
ncbi:spermidine/putrescine transport system permease protein [Micromonospora rhizosphaerae]|uniref:Spermidine/putrescine transport system permease protein n=1 Tax=Micromonospora rhizosphaerae TaxID=568872 RepID=A0A1C6SXV5_9ACTN|nr:ABC transporter permease [Micromonospora rhizosphaerae]SCL34320.1 spermidine/putrescine transport system permease protein [Micromonospora rhizosphaerae]